MKICQDCFCDTELKSMVASHKHLGVCDICGKSSYIYDTSINGELVDVIDDFMNIYSKADDTTPKKLRRNLEKELIDEWKIFSKTCSYKVKNIIKEIYSFSDETKERFDISLFDDEVYIPQVLDEEYLIKNYILQNYTWDEFINNIKYENRYHSKILNTKALDAFLLPLVRDYPAKSTFFRARISDSKGFTSKEMRMPPTEKARPGRIGAEGIPCFYLTNNVDTAIKEVRAGAFDYVTVAKFKLKNNIKVIDLRLLDSISPFSISEPISLAINKEPLLRLKAEVEKPVRVTENAIEYVPIQYFCDYIRSKGYKGIIYNSTMSATGYNLSAFSDVDFAYSRKDVYYIKDITVKFQKV